MERVRRTPDNKNNNKVWKTAIYIRLSKEDGHDESLSVTNQRQRLTAHFENLCLEDEMELVDIYIDDGFTGTDSDRDAFQRMLDDINTKRVNCVIVKDLSRLSRNYVESGHYLEYLFVKLDVRFVSLELPMLDSFKHPEQMNSIMVPMQSVFNDNHCRETSIKIRGTFDIKRRRGEFIGAFAPYGYKKDPNDKHLLIVDDEAASIVRDIFHWFVFDGMSRSGIVKKLIGMGIPCPAANKWKNGQKYCNPTIIRNDPQWSARTVVGVLTNRMYLGHMVQGKQRVKSYKVHTRISIPESDWFVVEDTHDPIIDQEMFDKAQSLIKRDTRTAPNSTQLYLFSGFLRCVDCGKAMGRRHSKNLVYYTCRSNSERGLCSRHSIRHDRLEKTVLTVIQKQIELIDDMSEVIDEINGAEIRRNVSNRVTASLKIKQQELEKISGFKSGLYMDWKNGDITREEYHKIKKDFEGKETQLKQDIASLEEECQVMAKGVSSKNSYFDTFIKHKNIENLDRGIITELIRTIHVHEGGGLTIDFNFADQHRRIIEFIENNRNDLMIIEGQNIG